MSTSFSEKFFQKYVQIVNVVLYCRRRMEILEKLEGAIKNG